MKNTFSVLAAIEMKPMLDRIGHKYQAEFEFFSGTETNLVERIACTQPDAVIINLFMPGQDAIEVIRAYKSLYSDSSTYFAVICPFVTGGLKREMKECGVHRVICRRDDICGLNNLLAEVSQIKSTPLASSRSAGTHAVHNLHHRGRFSGCSDTGELVSTVDGLLGALGLNGPDSGCRYLRRAVLLAAGAKAEDCHVTKMIYPTVAAEFGTTSSSVERRIRMTIDEAWHSGKSSTLSAYFGYTVDNMRGRPSNSEFIAMIADRVRLDVFYPSETASV